jgi:hypothetical protein
VKKEIIMLNEPRTYRNSPFQIWLLALIFGVLIVGLLTALDSSDYLILIPMAGFFVAILLVLLYSMTTKITISDNEISSQTLLGTKTLAWNEITRISGRGNGIKLHNNFGDVTVSPRPNLPGYDEIVNWIGVKRPDLFNPTEYNLMSRTWLNTLFPPSLGLIFIGAGLFTFTQSSDTLFPFLMFSIIGVVFIGMIFATPQSITIDGKSLLIKYLSSQRTLLAEEIASVDLRYTQTRNGKNYFIAIALTNKKSLRISGLSPSLPIVYLVLKNWNKKNATIGLTNQQN